MFVYLISICVPFIARKTVTLVKCSPANNWGVATQLMVVTRIMVEFVVPMLGTLLFDEDCFSQWTNFWSECSGDARDQFNQKVSIPFVGGLPPNEWISPGEYIVITPSDVCNPVYKQKRCPRAITVSLGRLQIGKTLVAASVGPLFMLLGSTKNGQRLMRWLGRMIVKPDYEPTISIDKELVNTAVLTEAVLVAGFGCPVLVPLTLIAVGARAVVFNLTLDCFGCELSEKASLPVDSLWVCCLGNHTLAKMLCVVIRCRRLCCKVWLW